MERDIMRETIKRNREALEMHDGTRLDETMVNRLVSVNRQLSIGIMNEDMCEYTIADGLIVAFGV